VSKPKRSLASEREKLFRSMPKRLQEIAGDLNSWLPSESKEFVEFFWRLLASVPGGEVVKDMGYEPLSEMIGWKELELITDTLDAIEDDQDVGDLLEYLDYEGRHEDEED
jgi:hypothetical protein